MNWYDALPITKVEDRLWLSNYYVASQLAKDNPYGITAILDVSDSIKAPEDELDAWMEEEEDGPVAGYDLPAGVEYRHTPFDDGKEIPADLFWSCMMYLEDMYRRGETILVHCIAGISRSPTIMASFMHYHLKWDFDKALNWITQRRTVVNPAVSVRVSAKKYLKVPPYDGRYGTPVVEEPFVWMDAARAVESHPDPECPLRKFFLIANKLGDRENTPRHTIPCTCKR